MAVTAAQCGAARLDSATLASAFCTGHMKLSRMISPLMADSKLSFRDATISDAQALNDLYNSAIREHTALEWDVERPLSETESYLKYMIQDEYPCILVFEGDELVAFAAFERFTVGDGQSCCPLLNVHLIIRRRRHELLYSSLFGSCCAPVQTSWYSQ